MTNMVSVKSKLSPAGLSWISVFQLLILIHSFFIWLFTPDWPTYRYACNFILVTSVFVCMSKCSVLYLCICVSLRWCYLCSDKTVNQINLPWKSLSAGPLCTVCICVCVGVCSFPPCISECPSSESLILILGVFSMCVYVCRKSTETVV